jgi:hypothetical protein
MTDDEFAQFWGRMVVASPPTNVGNYEASLFMYIPAPNVNDNEATNKLLREYGTTAEEAKAEYQRRCFPNHQMNRPLVDKWMAVAGAQKQQ